LKLRAVKLLALLLGLVWFCSGLGAFEQADALQLIQAEVISRNAFLKPGDLQIQILNWQSVKQNLNEITASHQNFSMQFTPGVRMLGRVVLPLKVSSAHEQVRWINLYAQVDAKVPLCVAAKNLAAKIKVEVSMLQPATKNIAALPGGFVHSCQSLLGLETRLYVPSGAVLYEHQFREVPQIREQESISMQFSREGVHLKMEGLALEDGVAGQVISVKNIRSGKKLKGRVTGFRTVEIVP
jgi:flagella basal body P-ring formation protein FlgA